MEIPKLNISVTKSAVNGQVVDVIEYDAYCKDKGMTWSASPWDMPSLEFLLNYDIPYIKVASASNGRDEMISEAAKSGKPVILSTSGRCILPKKLRA